MASTRKEDTFSSPPKYLRFRCNGVDYAIEAVFVKEVYESTPITTVPLSKNYVVGLANIRGEAVPIFDFSKFVSKESCNNAAKLIVLRDEKQGDFAIAVESVVGLESFKDAKLDNSEGNIKNDLICKIIERNSQRIQLINFQNFISDGGIRDIHEQRRRLSQEKYFWFGNNKSASNLLELIEGIKTMDDLTFSKHANSNDFSSWIKDCLCLPELANKIKGKPKKEVVDRLLAYLPGKSV